MTNFLSKNYEHNQIEKQFTEEAEDIIDEILGETTSNEQKEQLLNSVSYIFNKLSDEYLTSVEDYNYKQRYAPIPSNQIFNNGASCINIILTPNPPISFPQQPLYYNQSPIIPVIHQMPFSISPYPNQIPISPPQQFSNPQNPYPYPLSPYYDTKSHKKDKKKHKKSSKKDSKSKSKSKSDTKKSKSAKIMTFVFDKSKSFLNGMVNYLTSISSGNPHDNGTIEVTSNDCLDNSHPKNLLNLNSESNFLEGDLSGNSLYIRFDFKKMSVEISQYAIKGCGEGHAILKNWVFEISDDGQKWTEIDRRNEYDFISDENVFDVEKKKFARFCQIRQIGPHSDDFHRLWINAVEFYGKLKIP